jgi:hypothetical protein
VAIDGSKFKAVNSRDRNFTPAKIDKRKEQIEESIQRYMCNSPTNPVLARPCAAGQHLS